MTTPTLTRAQAKLLGACDEALNLLKPRVHYTARMAREAGCSLTHLLWALDRMARHDHSIAKRRALFAADCAERVLPIFEARFPNDTRPRKAIQAARDWAAGLIDDVAGAAGGARDAAWAARAAADAAGAAGDAARAAEKAWQYDRLIYWMEAVI